MRTCPPCDDMCQQGRRCPRRDSSYINTDAMGDGEVVVIHPTPTEEKRPGLLATAWQAFLKWKRK